MEQKLNRKTDRRTLYTRNIIKDALLECMKEHSFEKLTVTSICKAAEVTRTTFYLHYNNLTDVLDELLSDALHLTEGEGNPIDNMHRLIQLFSMENNNKNYQQLIPLMPLCQRIADIPKYQVLFKDEYLSSYVLKTLYKAEKDEQVPLLMSKLGLSESGAQSLFMFLLHGLYVVNKSCDWKKDSAWYETQLLLTKFIQAGLSSLAMDKRSSK